MSQTQIIYSLLAISFVASFSKWGARITYPLRIFSTWIHECAHALTATLLGASSVSMTLASDGSGLTRFKIAPSRLRQSIIASAGYLGTTISGCALLYLAERRSIGSIAIGPKHTFLILAGLTALTLIIWIRNAFGFFTVAALGALFSGIFYYPPLGKIAPHALLFIGIHTALHSLFDLKNLYRVGGSKSQESDAETLARLFFLPAWIWATLWLGIAIAVCYQTFRTLSLI